jgi:hypothetical protein
MILDREVMLAPKEEEKKRGGARCGRKETQI